MTEAPGQFKQPSRKGKKAWRKNVDITAVQKGLETVRDEVIKGGVVAEKPSAELFTLDPTGDQHIQRAYNKVHKPLKADEILAQRSAVPAIDSRKRPASHSTTTTDGVLESSNKKRRSGYVSHKELERLTKLAHGGEHVYKDVVAFTDVPRYDPWAEENQNAAMQEMDAKYSFLEAKRPVKEPKTLKRAPVALAVDGKEISAVPKPKPEASYNPNSTDYFDAYMREGEKAVEEEKKRLRAAEEERDRLERAAKSGAEADAKEKDLLDDGNDESEWEGVESEVEASSRSVKRPERKTKAQRNKIARRKEAERKAALEAVLKKRAQQAAQVKAIARSIKGKERASSTAAVIAKEDDDQDQDETTVKLRKRRFGKAPIPQEMLELVLPDKLQDSLRLLKPEGNLLRDRFRSALLRGKIESRNRITQHRQARTTVTEKWTYKDWKLIA
ncbi:MAG: hypothetical protein M1816_005606 [Peltula sp. TS41687]|nr:MAG: hypothetical protein M1816_005606 [Peltula sp. TS41687]